VALRAVPVRARPGGGEGRRGGPAEGALGGRARRDPRVGGRRVEPAPLRALGPRDGRRGVRRRGPAPSHRRRDAARDPGAHRAARRRGLGARHLPRGLDALRHGQAPPGQARRLAARVPRGDDRRGAPARPRTSRATAPRASSSPRRTTCRSTTTAATSCAA
jgi:hypothetical protein